MNEINALFHPHSIAIIGASSNPKKIGYQILSNIISSGYEGKIYPVNPEAKEILGIKAYPSIKEINDYIDLAIIAIPAPYVPSVLEECGIKKVKVVIVISSGFKEIGNIALENEALSIAKKYGMRILGPNVFGIYYASSKLNATFGPKSVYPGKIALITQSGALGIALMGWTNMNKIGLSAVVSIGNRVDIDESDILDYLSLDNETKVIIIYMEGTKDGRKLMKSLYNINKPVIIIKSGRSKIGSIAASSHTGSLVGSDIVYTTAFKQCGALRAYDVLQAFDWAKVMSMQPPPINDEAVIITNGGGIGVMAADACEEYGVKLSILPEDLQYQFKKIIPFFGNAKNPIDLTGQANEEDYYKALEIALKDDRIGSIILLYCQTAITNPLKIAESIINACSDINKTIVTCFIGDIECENAMKKLEENSIPTYPIPERAVSSLAVYYKWLKYKKRKINPTISF
jgi:acetyl-CoA synthetase (ADP-forming)